MTTRPENFVSKMTVPLSSSFQGQDNPCAPNPAPRSLAQLHPLSPEEPTSNLRGLTRVVQAGQRVENSFLPLRPWGNAPVLRDPIYKCALGALPICELRVVLCVCCLECDLGLSAKDKWNQNHKLWISSILKWAFVWDRQRKKGGQ